MNSKISARVIAFSKNVFGDELVTFELVYPRIIHAEAETHRMFSDQQPIEIVTHELGLMNEKDFSRNAASSRAIPFRKMVKSVMDDPFTPIAFQKHHSGMQGVHYLDPLTEISFSEFLVVLQGLLDNVFSPWFIEKMSERFKDAEYTPEEWWLQTRDMVVFSASMVYAMGATKQLANRVLEPFQYYKVLVTTGKEGLNNFFDLRCPQYYYEAEEKSFKSKKDFSNYWFDNFGSGIDEVIEGDPILWWLGINKSQAEIHIQALAEAMYDAYNEATPTLLQPGEWHIPYLILTPKLAIKVAEYLDKSELEYSKELIDLINVKCAVALCAQVSYTVVGEDDKELDIAKLIALYDRLAAMRHASPFEHVAKAMGYENVRHYSKAYEKKGFYLNSTYTAKKEETSVVYDLGTDMSIITEYGWCRNFRGFIQQRHLLNL